MKFVFISDLLRQVYFKYYRAQWCC